MPQTQESFVFVKDSLKDDENGDDVEYQSLLSHKIIEKRSFQPTLTLGFPFVGDKNKRMHINTTKHIILLRNACSIYFA